MSEYRSNDGRGPYRARVVSVDGELVTLERWHEKRPNRRTVFRLARWFLSSPSCGWKKEK